MEYVICKMVGKFPYFWNRSGKKWEGLINNATVYQSHEIDFEVSFITGAFKKEYPDGID